MPFTDIRRPSILDSNAVADKFKLCSRDYNELSNKPTINGCILAGDISFDYLGLPEVVAACTQAYAENCIFPYVDCCMDAMCECLYCTVRDITENVECLHSATVACINETKTCLACDINTVNTNLTLCINCVSCDLTSCINAVCTDLEEAIDDVSTCLSNDIADINSLIPTQASDINQLADKAFVNSTVGTNTANYICFNGGPFPSVACLLAYSGTLTNNDYAFVCGIDTCGNAYYDRYKYSEATDAWGCEYRLNNSSFTASQWATINSGISSDVLPSDMSDSNKLVTENDLATKQDTLTAAQLCAANSGITAAKVQHYDESISSTHTIQYAFDLFMPVGHVVIQRWFEDDPNTKYNVAGILTSTWVDVSAKEAGLHERVAGCTAEAFNKQATICCTGCCDANYFVCTDTVGTFAIGQRVMNPVNNCQGSIYCVPDSNGQAAYIDTDIGMCTGDKLIIFQDSGLPDVKGCFGFPCDLTGATGMVYFDAKGAFFGQSGYLNIGGFTTFAAQTKSNTYICFEASHSCCIYGRQCDVTVKNATIKLWQRIA